MVNLFEEELCNPIEFRCREILFSRPIVCKILSNDNGNND